MSLPSLPTTRLSRSSSSAMRSFSSTTSLKASATLPATPVQSQRQPHAGVALAQRHQRGQQRVQLVGLERARHFHDRHGALQKRCCCRVRRRGAHWREACTLYAHGRKARCLLKDQALARLKASTNSSSCRGDGKFCCTCGDGSSVPWGCSEWRVPSRLHAQRPKRRPKVRRDLGPLGVWSLRQESNLYLALRRRSFYPLNYGGRMGRI